MYLLRICLALTFYIGYCYGECRNITCDPDDRDCQSEILSYVYATYCDGCNVTFGRNIDPYNMPPVVQIYQYFNMTTSSNNSILTGLRNAYVEEIKICDDLKQTLITVSMPFLLLTGDALVTLHKSRDFPDQFTTEYRIQSSNLIATIIYNGTDCIDPFSREIYVASMTMPFLDSGPEFRGTATQNPYVAKVLDLIYIYMDIWTREKMLVLGTEFAKGFLSSVKCQRPEESK